MELRIAKSVLSMARHKPPHALARFAVRRLHRKRNRRRQHTYTQAAARHYRNWRHTIRTWQAYWPICTMLLSYLLPMFGKTRSSNEWAWSALSHHVKLKQKSVSNSSYNLFTSGTWRLTSRHLLSFFLNGRLTPSEQFGRLWQKTNKGMSEWKPILRCCATCAHVVKWFHSDFQRGCTREKQRIGLRPLSFFCLFQLSYKGWHLFLSD